MPELTASSSGHGSCSTRMRPDPRPALAMVEVVTGIRLTLTEVSIDPAG